MNLVVDLVVDSCLTGILSPGTKTDSESVLSFYIEPMNIKSVLVVFRVSLCQIIAIYCFSWWFSAG